MQKIFFKRAVRDLKANFMRYLALGLLIIMGMYLVVSMTAAAELIITGTEKSSREHNAEDGQFSVFLPLTNEEEKLLADNGIFLEKMFSLDYSLSDGSFLRVFKNRREIDLIALDDGRLAENQCEIVIEKRYAEEHDLNTGNKITFGGKEFEVVGIGSVPDYDAPYRELSDSAVDSVGFGLAFVTEEAYSELLSENKSQRSENLVYAYRLNGNTSHSDLKELLNGFEISADEVEDEFFQEYWKRTGGKKDDIIDGINELNKGAETLSDGLKELSESAEAIPMLPDEFKSGISDSAEGAKSLSDGTSELKEQTNEIIEKYFDIKLSKLTMLLKAEDNMRIGAAADDQVINKVCGLLAGVIVMALFTYVISVFVIHGIDKESSIIGALYALGVKRRDLIFHYLMIPVAVTFVSGLIGAALGLSEFAIQSNVADCYEYFSIPEMEPVYPIYLIIYSVLMPPVVAAIVNYFVIKKRLSKTALSLIRNEQKSRRINSVDLGKMKFIPRFQIRQMLKELRTGFTVFFGMFFSMLVLMLCIDVYVMCNNIKSGAERDTKFNYMYVYKYPEETVPEGSSEAFVKSLKRENLGYNLEVTILGITADNPYFSARPEKGENKVVVSSATAQKFALKIGDDLILKDEDADRSYVFTVTDIAVYSPALYVFMDIDSMRSLFGESEDYFNAVFSDRELDIPSGRLSASVKRSDIVHSLSIFVDMMMPMIITLSAASVLIFCVVMYLMIGVMIDRSAFGISLIKIFGFRTKEIRRLYLDGNLFTIAIGALISIPLSKKAIDMIYPFMVSNVACGMELEFTPQIYIGVFAAVIILYLIIDQVLVRKIQKIVPAEVLKNRE
ncbi:MAG: ABC transporter permease [Oscillospiraceae bacterium]|nr:ABC transporter permease [Oscillospiraceae bacterium]